MVARSHLRRTIAAIGLAVFACSSSTVPTGPIAPQPASGPAVALAGRVVHQFDGSGLAGVVVHYAGGSATTDADGRFAIPGGFGDPRLVAITGQGIHSREAYAAGQDVRLEVVPTGFDMSAFHDVGREHSGRTIRWLGAPSIYVDTRVVGAEIEPAELARWVDEIERLAPSLVAEWTGGAFDLRPVMVGKTPPASGAIVFRFDEDPDGYPNTRIAGMTLVTWGVDGAIDAARVRLRLSGLGGPAGAYARQAVLAHEIGHALGLSHMDGETSSILTPVIRTPVLTDFDRAAGRILYSRPPGNTSLDRDTRAMSVSLATSGGPTAGAESACDASALLGS